VRRLTVLPSVRLPWWHPAGRVPAPDAIDLAIHAIDARLERAALVISAQVEAEAAQIREGIRAR
jgi:hypothetical protein